MCVVLVFELTVVYCSIGMCVRVNCSLKMPSSNYRGLPNFCDYHIIACGNYCEHQIIAYPLFREHQIIAQPISREHHILARRNFSVSYCTLF